MGNSIDKIDEGFFICGVEALGDIERLKGLGITHILNAAYMDLYKHASRDDANSFLSLPDIFTLHCLECEDAESCNLSVHFNRVANFIEEGRRAGGVVVHCAAGISRASTSACAYLMIKQSLSLEAALHKVHSVRNVVHPNSGFWRQLRDLEAVLRLQGAALQPLPADAGQAPPAGQAEAEKRAFSWNDNSDFRALLEQLDSSLHRTQSFGTHHLTARLDAAEGVPAPELAERLRASKSAGVVWEELKADEGGASLGVRAKVVPSMDAAAFKALLAQIPGVKLATCE